MFRKKTILMVIILIFLALFSQSSALDNDNLDSSRHIKVWVNQKFIFSDAESFIVNGRTQVPLRFVSNELGYTVNWNGETKTITIANDEKTLLFTLGSKFAVLNGKKVELEHQLVVKNNRSFIPLRYTVELFGEKVDYDKETMTAVIGDDYVSDAFYLVKYYLGEDATTSTKLYNFLKLEGKQDDVITSYNTETEMKTVIIEELKAVIRQDYRKKHLSGVTELSRYKENGKYGFIDKSGNKVVKPDFEILYSYKDGIAIYAKEVLENGKKVYKYGYLDSEGQEITDAIYDDADYFSDGLARVVLSKNGKKNYLYLDKDLKVVLTIENGKSYSFHNGVAKYKVGEGDNAKFGYIDKTGKEVIPCKYYKLGNFSSGLARFKLDKDGKYGYINEYGEVVIEPNFVEAYDFDDDIAIVKYSNQELLYGFITKNGTEVMIPKYDIIKKVVENIAVCGINQAGSMVYGVVDIAGVEVIKPIYQDLGSLSDGVHVYKKDNLYGIMDKDFNVVVEPKFLHLKSFADERAVFMENAEKSVKCGVVDKTGRIIVPAIYDEIKDFSEGLAIVRLGFKPNSKYGAIDKDGNVVIPIKYDSLTSFTKIK